MKPIRNFAIIAHVDHGKSTLADRMLEVTGTVVAGSHDDQMLDRNPISRERGITIKLAPVRMQYKDHTLNLIDTPGHVDFSYEVDRTLACVEGAVLLVDATQGVQAQTVANCFKAIDKNLTILPIINKIDLPTANVKKVAAQLIEFLGISESDIQYVSAKTGQGVPEILDKIIDKIPPPRPAEKSEPRALIFDSYYDSHRGVIAFVRIFGGTVKKRDSLELKIAGNTFVTTEVGIFTPDLIAKDSLTDGEIGYIMTNLKDIHMVKVGDTIVAKNSDISAVAGYKEVKPMVYASFFTTDPNQYLNLSRALEKLYLNDSALIFTPIYSRALGAGFRVGFLGLLHADVVRERLEREYALDLILTPPQVEYLKDANGYLEPYVEVLVVTPSEYLNAVIRLIEEYRGEFVNMDNKSQVTITYRMPMSEMISDFFDKLKSTTSGYASLDWELAGFVPVEAARLDISLNDEIVDEFSQVVVHARAQNKARELVSRIKEVIPRQQYDVKVKAAYNGKPIASEKISALRKDVTAKLYGGDRTRKDKLLKKQKAGKKKMKMVGRVEIPKEAFLKLFKNQ